MNINPSRIIATGVGALIGTTLLLSQPTHAGSRPAPRPAMVASDHVDWSQPTGTCPAIDLAPAAVLKLGPCGRLESVARRSAGGGPAGTISIAYLAPSTR